MPPKRKANANASSSSSKQIRTTGDSEDFFVYRVLRLSDDDKNQIGIYSTLSEANDVARKILLAEWSHEDFETYDEEFDHDGLVTVNATFEEGEREEVRVVQEEPEKVYLVSRYSEGRKENLGIYQSLGSAEARCKSEVEALAGEIKGKVEHSKELEGTVSWFDVETSGTKRVLVEMNTFKLRP